MHVWSADQILQTPATSSPLQPMISPHGDENACRQRDGDQSTGGSDSAECDQENGDEEYGSAITLGLNLVDADSLEGWSDGG